MVIRCPPASSEAPRRLAPGGARARRIHDNGESMDEDNRGGGDGFVRIKKSALTSQYTGLASESEVEEMLERELTRSGWTVHRQVHCHTSENKWRRCDMVAIGEPVRSSGSGWTGSNIPEQMVIGIEIKHRYRARDAAEAFMQIRQYATSCVWSTLDQPRFPRPDWFLYTDGDLLVSDDNRLHFGAFNASLRECGGSVLHRNIWGNLEFDVRHGMVDEDKKGRRRVRAGVSRMMLTRWQTWRTA
jgi:hypothetical protein